MSRSNQSCSTEKFRLQQDFHLWFLLQQAAEGAKKLLKCSFRQPNKRKQGAVMHCEKYAKNSMNKTAKKSNLIIKETTPISSINDHEVVTKTARSVDVDI